MSPCKKSKLVQQIKGPRQSVWFGVEPVLIFSKILGYWPCASFGAAESVQKNCQIFKSYYWPSMVWKDWLIFTVHLVVSIYMGVLAVIGEGKNQYWNATYKYLSYVNVIANSLLHILPRLLTVAALPKLVQFFNKIANLDCQLQVHPEDCLELRRKSWAISTWLALVAVIHFGLSAVNFKWWRKAGESDIAGFFGIICPPAYVVCSSSVVFFLLQLINTLEHRFRLVTSQVIEILERAEKNPMCDERPTTRITSSTTSHDTLASKLNAIRQKHEFLQDCLDLLCNLSGVLIGCIIPIQVFLTITDSFAIVRKISIWIVEDRFSHLFSVILRVLCWTTDIVAIFWAADKLKSQMMSISRAIQKQSFLGLNPDEQLQVQLLSTLANRCKEDIRPAGFFSLSCSAIPSLIANFTTFFIVQFQTYAEANESEPIRKNFTLLPGN